MNDTIILLPIGTRVRVLDQDEQETEGTIVGVDEHDLNLPYRVYRENDRQEGWYSHGDVEVLVPAPTQPLDTDEQMTPPVLARRLYDGFVNRNVTLRDMATMANMLTVMLEAVPEEKMVVAQGTCSICMDTVTFNASVGTWEHEGLSVPDHKPPAILLGV